MRRRAVAWLSGAILALWAGAAASDCGGPSAPCDIAGGSYHVALPETPRGAPVVLWLHGYGRSGAGVVKNSGRLAPFTARGYAVVAPNGQPDIGAPKALDWGVHDGHRRPRDDLTFLAAVKADAVERFGLDGARVLAAGFSRGGSMVWDLACHEPGIASAFAAVAGAFWEPMVKDCAGPVRMHHTHGFSDRLVPLEGRKATFHGFDYEQGDVLKAIQVWRRVNGCPGSAENHATDGRAWIKSWEKCAAGSLTLTLTPGGHGIPKGWADTVLDWFEARP